MYHLMHLDLLPSGALSSCFDVCYLSTLRSDKDCNMDDLCTTVLALLEEFPIPGRDYIIYANANSR